MELLLLFSPMILVLSAAVSLFLAIRNWPARNHGLAAFSLILFGIALLSNGFSASHGEFAGVWAFLMGIGSTFIVIFLGVWMVWALPVRGKRLGIFLMILLPFLLISLALRGDEYSPERLTARNGDQIIRRIESYRLQHDRFPFSLNQLVPDHISELPDALTTQGTGWLYVSDGRSYTLGYWYYPHKFGVILCRYGSGSAAWECKPTSRGSDWEPFEPVPTPTPGTSGV